MSNKKEDLSESGGTCCSVDESEGSKTETGIGVFSALLASTCCWLPAMLIAFGVSAVGVGSFFRAYHVPVAIVSGLLLLSGWWLYLSKRIKGNVPWRSGWMTGVILGASTLFAGYYLGPHYYGYRLFGDTRKEEVNLSPSEKKNLIRTTFTIRGMSCRSCATSIEAGLSKIEGVHKATVSFSSAKATVLSSGEISRSTFRTTVEKVGYEIEEFHAGTPSDSS